MNCAELAEELTKVPLHQWDLPAKPWQCLHTGYRFCWTIQKKDMDAVNECLAVNGAVPKITIFQQCTKVLWASQVWICKSQDHRQASNS